MRDIRKKLKMMKTYHAVLSEIVSFFSEIKILKIKKPTCRAKKIIFGSTASFHKNFKNRKKKWENENFKN